MIKKIIAELKKTTWPTGSQLINLTIYTLVLCAVVAFIILGLDLLFFEIRDWFLNI
jgi:preprotein translocase SecE subunit